MFFSRIFYQITIFEDNFEKSVEQNILSRMGVRGSNFLQFCVYRLFGEQYKIFDILGRSGIGAIGKRTSFRVHSV